MCRGVRKYKIAHMMLRIAMGTLKPGPHHHIHKKHRSTIMLRDLFKERNVSWCSHDIMLYVWREYNMGFASGSGQRCDHGISTCLLIVLHDVVVVVVNARLPIDPLDSDLDQVQTPIVTLQEHMFQSAWILSLLNHDELIALLLKTRRANNQYSESTMVQDGNAAPIHNPTQLL